MSIEEEIADEISGIQVGSGYYATTIGIAAAQEAAAAVMPLVKRAQAEAIREAAKSLNENFQEIPAWMDAYRNGQRTDEWVQGGVRMVMSAIDVLGARADRIESEVPGV